MASNGFDDAFDRVHSERKLVEMTPLHDVVVAVAVKEAIEMIQLFPRLLTPLGTVLVLLRLPLT